VERRPRWQERGGGIAEEALLREVRRLCTAPWTPQAERQLIGADPDAPRALHGQLANTEASALIDAFLARGDRAGLRPSSTPS